MVRQVVEGYPNLPEQAFVMARQENLETIHRHNVVAERYGTLADLRVELDSGEHLARHMTMREWLEAPSSSVDA
jgi:GTP cyclohydrolase I/GTP cyclohydrolase-4